MTPGTFPAYCDLHRRGELRARARQLRSHYRSCRLCPWCCGADRDAGETGRCRAPAGLRIARCCAHPGEEPPISGTRGSGTIFFSHCNLQCVFCQNWQISQAARGDDRTPAQLAREMLALQHAGCHNINLVSPTPYLPDILDALDLAVADGLSIPIVYNSNGYESVETLRMLEGIVDLYLPDLKYGRDEPARTYSGARDYCRISQAAVAEMLRQVGHLTVDAQGIARQGLIVRHLVLPGGCAASTAVLTWLRNACGPHLWISLMGQYRPCYRSGEFAEIAAPLATVEYERVAARLDALEFGNGWLQWPDQLDTSLLPDFRKPDTWN